MRCQQPVKIACGSGGIRTHASEETGALNQRLRPLGHATGTSAVSEKLETGLHTEFWGSLLTIALIWWRFKLSFSVFLDLEFFLYLLGSVALKRSVRSGIRTHAQRTGLRPERSALDRSAILTTALLWVSCEKGADFQFGVDEKKTWRIRVSIPVPLAC